MVGEPGIGKTRLLGEICSLATSLDVLVLRGIGEGRRSDLLYGALSEPFARLVAATADGADRSLAAIASDPDVGRLAALGHEQDLDDDRLGTHVVADLVRRVLRRLARSGPVLLALDDVQWADEGSLDVLSSLGRHLPSGGVVTVLGYRPLPGLGSFATIRPGRVEGPVIGTVARLELAALTEQQIAELLPGTPPARRRALYAACGGNPFYLQSVSSAVTDIPLAEPGAAPHRLPDAVRTALAAELDALDGLTRRVADTAAVLGGVLDVDLLAHVAGLELTVVLDALDVLSSRAICREVSAGRWQFRHPMLAQAAYDAQSTASRHRAHTAAAAELEQRSAPIAERARHLAASSRRGDEASARTIAEAADQLAGQAPGQAAQWYAIALDLAPLDDRAWVKRVRLARAQALTAVGEVDTARTILHDLLAAVPAADPLRVRAAALSARVAYLLGQHREAEAILQRELTAPVEREPASLAAVHVELATARLMSADFAAARDAAEQALLLAPSSEQATVAGAASAITLSAAVSGDIELALERLSGAAALVDGMSDAELAASLEVGVWLGWAEMFLEQVGEASRHLERCVRIARRGAHQHLLTHLLVGWGSVLKIRGDLTAATEAFDEARESAERVGSRELTTMATAMQCRAATWRGDVRAAQAYGAEAVALTADRSTWFSSVAQALLAQARLAGGDASGCVDAILRAGGGPDMQKFDPASRCDWWEVAVTAALLDGDTPTARDLSARSSRCADELPLRGPSGCAALAEARILLADGLFADAAERAAAAQEHFAAVGHRLEAARASYLEGVARGESGERSGALELLTAAEATFASCRAARLRAEARGALRRLGRRVAAVEHGDEAGGAGRADSDSPLDRLSARERQVALLVAEGMTNRQVAGKLVVSEKTVESHLSHIFVKLGVTSRAALATAIAHVEPAADARQPAR